LHREILNRLGPSPTAEDQLIRDLQKPARHVSPALVTLELTGQIARNESGLLTRTD
jgi:DNA processing protein